MRKNILLLCILGNPYELINGGHQRTIREIIEQFVNHKDLNFTIITSKVANGKGYISSFIGSNINYFEIKIPELWVREQNYLYENKDYLSEQIDIILEAVSDISLVHSTYWISGLLGITLAKKYHCKQVHYPISTAYEKVNHGIPPRSKYQRQTEELCFAHSSLILVITKAEADILHQEYNVSYKKIHIMGRIVNPCFQNVRLKISENISNDTLSTIYNDFAKLNSPEWWNKSVFCYIGRIVDYKGIKEIISAWTILYERYKEKTPPLWLIGGTVNDILSYRNIVLNHIPKLVQYEKEHKIYWWGYSTSEGLSAILSKCSVMIMHSAFEPGGRVMLEAFATGTPVISTPFGFSKDAIKNWLNGFTIPYGNIRALSHFMNLFIKNEYLSNMLGLQAQYTFETLQKEWKYFETLDSIYQDTFQNRPLNFEKRTSTEYKHLLVNTFPYCDIKNDPNDLCQTFLLSEVEECQTSHSYLWKSKNLYIKQYFNRLNIHQLWNITDSTKVICLTDLYTRSLNSQKFKSILPILDYSNQLFTYTMPCATLVSASECFNNMEYLLSKLYKEGNVISETASSTDHKYYTFTNLISEVLHSLELNINLFEKDVFLLLKRILKILAEYKYNTYYSFNYGKSIIDHVVQYNNQLYLLPSGTMFYGEIGFDYAFTYLNYFKSTDLMNMLNSPNQDRMIVYWTCCLIIEQYIQNCILYIDNKISIQDIYNIVVKWFDSYF